MAESDADDFSTESIDPRPREDGEPGPPDDWPYASYYDRRENDWWWKGKTGWARDPCPVSPLGRDGEGGYYFVTSGGVLRRFTSGSLHGRGGLTDLFEGRLAWPMRHFRDYDLIARQHKGGVKLQACMSKMVEAACAAGYYDGAIPHRSIGTWRGPDGQPLVHAGNRLFCPGGLIEPPGSLLADALYVVGADRAPPAHMTDDKFGTYQWMPAPLSACHAVAADLALWPWSEAEAGELYLGGLFCDMLGDAIIWKPHKFVRAPAGSGKSTLLKWTRALLGGAAHPVQGTYSRAWLEQKFAHTACALLLDEAESENDQDRFKKLNQIIVLLSGEGVQGGRGSAGGIARTIDLHGSVTMVATITDEWKQTIRSRVAFLELRGRREPLSTKAVEDLMRRAESASAGLRARALARFDLFQRNLELVRTRILELGGQPRDADQLGHLIAGWACMTFDEPLSEDEIGRLDRFKAWILTVQDEADGSSEADVLWNAIMGAPGPGYRSGERWTMGQLIARARLDENLDLRRTLLAIGVRFHKLPAERFDQAWLAIANNSVGLDQVMRDAGVPAGVGQRRAQVLSELRRGLDEAKPTEGALRFAGVQSRAWLIPPVFLPTLAEEAEAIGNSPAPPKWDGDP